MTENSDHIILPCPAYSIPRKAFLQNIKQVTLVHFSESETQINITEKQLLQLILDPNSIARCLERKKNKKKIQRYVEIIEPLTRDYIHTLHRLRVRLHASKCRFEHEEAKTSTNRVPHWNKGNCI